MIKGREPPFFFKKSWIFLNKKVSSHLMCVMHEELLEYIRSWFDRKWPIFSRSSNRANILFLFSLFSEIFWWWYWYHNVIIFRYHDKHNLENEFLSSSPVELSIQYKSVHKRQPNAKKKFSSLQVKKASWSAVKIANLFRSRVLT